MRDGSIAFPCRDRVGSISAIRRRRPGPRTTSSSWTLGSSPGSRPSTRPASGCCRCPPGGSGGASWSWTEVYGPVAVSAEAVHGEWADAVECLEPAVAEAQAESVLGGGARADGRQGERVHTGSGWGALESLRREMAGEPPSPVIDRLFPRSSLGDDQESWIALLETGTLPSGTPRSYVVGRSWSGLVEAAADSAASMLHRGVVRWSAGHREAAVEAWEAACTLEPDSWLALRNLAGASGLMGAPGRSAEQYLRALDLMPDLPQLRVEAIEALIAADRLAEAIALAQTAPPSSFAGRFRLLEARAAMLHGDNGRAESILAGRAEWWETWVADVPSPTSLASAESRLRLHPTTPLRPTARRVLLLLRAGGPRASTNPPPDPPPLA